MCLEWGLGAEGLFSASANLKLSLRACPTAECLRAFALPQRLLFHVTHDEWEVGSGGTGCLLTLGRHLRC